MCIRDRWGFGVIGFALMALLPIYTPGFLDTPGVSFDGVMAQFTMIALVAIGLNVVVGQAGLLDLGYVGFYAVGAYAAGFLVRVKELLETRDWSQEL